MGMHSGSNVGSGEGPQTSNLGTTGTNSLNKLAKIGLGGFAGGLRSMNQQQPQLVGQQNPFLQQMNQRNPFYGG